MNPFAVAFVVSLSAGAAGCVAIACACCTCCCCCIHAEDCIDPAVFD